MSTLSSNFKVVVLKCCESHWKWPWHIGSCVLCVSRFGPEEHWFLWALVCRIWVLIVFCTSLFFVRFCCKLKICNICFAVVFSVWSRHAVVSTRLLRAWHLCLLCQRREEKSAMEFFPKSSSHCCTQRLVSRVIILFPWTIWGFPKNIYLFAFFAADDWMLAITSCNL